MYFGKIEDNVNSWEDYSEYWSDDIQDFIRVDFKARRNTKPPLGCITLEAKLNGKVIVPFGLLQYISLEAAAEAGKTITKLAPLLK